VRGLSPYFAATVGRDTRLRADGWVTTEQLVSPDAAHLAALLQRYGDHWGTSDRRIQGSFALIGYAWSVLAPVVAAYLADGRVPRISDGRVAVWLDPGEDGAVALSGIVVDGEALRDALHDEVVDHMRPVVAAFRAETPLGSRVLWLITADMIAGAFQLAGEALGQEDRAIAEAKLVLGRPSSPLRSPRISFRRYEHLGDHRTLAVRASCCLSYRLDGSGYCMSCPLLAEPERIERVNAWIAEELQQAPATA
jgi:ferric iron reductase protein FhuF